MSTQTKTAGRRKGDAYLTLIRKFPLRPIRSDKGLAAANAMVDSLFARKKLTREEKDYLEVLQKLIADYEREHYPVEPVSDGELLHHLMEARGVTQVDVARATGIVNTTISAVLAGRRTLTREHVGKLAGFFHVSPGAFYGRG